MGCCTLNFSESAPPLRESLRKNRGAGEVADGSVVAISERKAKSAIREKNVTAAMPWNFKSSRSSHLVTTQGRSFLSATLATALRGGKSDVTEGRGVKRAVHVEGGVFVGMGWKPVGAGVATPAWVKKSVHSARTQVGASSL